MKKAKSVTVIPAKINRITKSPIGKATKRRTAGYARVSTDSSEQFTSYEAQVDYYTTYINSRADWEFIKVYTDEGISGLNTKKREGFNQMIADALAGQIDLIITKSVSRFARNTVDSLTTIRKLKDKGVEVFFEKENIWTLDSKGELLLTIMSSLAQEESRSISENVTWGQRKRFADGQVSLPYKSFLGYRKGADGNPEVVPEEAKIIRRIYREFLFGKPVSVIARELIADGIPTPTGKTNWTIKNVTSILQNEKYKGSALLQKKFTVDFLQKKTKINEGEVPQYYIEYSHEAIIEPVEWEKVQLELARRRETGHPTRYLSVFSGKIRCGDCDSVYVCKIWNSNDKYRREVWQCVNKYRNETICKTPHFNEDDFKKYFLIALSKLLKNRDTLIRDSQIIYDDLLSYDDIERQIDEIIQESEIVEELVEKCVQENAQIEQDQTEYLKRYNSLVERFEKLQDTRSKLEKVILDRKMSASAIEDCIKAIKDIDLLQIEFNDTLWYCTVDYATVYNDNSIVYHFKSGHDIKVEI